MQQIKEASKKAKKAKLDPELVSKSQEKEDSVEEAIENGVKCPEEEETVNKAVDDLFGAKISGSSIQDLRAKLHERIEMLKERRISKNPEKHQEILKKKAQAKVKKEKKKMHQKMKNESVLAKTDTLKTKEKPKAPAVGKEAVVFSKFAMSTEEKKKPQKKDLTKILKNIEKKKENLEILKTKNPQKLKEIVTNEAWNKAILKSEGEKIKDDPKLIKKSIKAEQKKKSKSASDWAKRIADVEERTKARQTKRSENIQKRKEDINAKKNKKVKMKFILETKTRI